MHIAVVLEIHDRLLPALQRMAQVLEEKATAWIHVIKIGRTHLQDATPVTTGQEFSAFAAQVRLGIQRVQNTLPHLYALPFCLPDSWKPYNRCLQPLERGSMLPLALGSCLLKKSGPSQGIPLSQPPINSKLWPPTMPWWRVPGP